MFLSLRWRINFYFSLLFALSAIGLVMYITMAVNQAYLEDIQNKTISQAHMLSTRLNSLLEKNASYETVLEWLGEENKLLNVNVEMVFPGGKRVTGDGTTVKSVLHLELMDKIQRALASKGVSQSISGTGTPLPEDMARNISQPGEEFVHIQGDLWAKKELWVVTPVYDQEQNVAVVLLVHVFLEGSLLEYHWQSIMLAIALSIGVSIVLFNIILRILLKPLRQLTTRVQQIAIEPAPPVPDGMQLDEIGQLQQAFQRMASQLNAQIVALKSERGKLAAVLTNMNESILIVDQAGAIQLMNPAAERLFGVNEAEAMGHSIVQIVRQHQLVELWRNCQLSGNAQSTTLETSTSQHFLFGMATPLFEAIPGAILVVIQDLTRLRKLEVVRRDFVSNVSHELRTPLASLKALTETLLDGALDDLPAARRFLLRMDSEIDNLTQMVRELLELSRIESRRVPIERKSISPYDLLYPSLDRMQIQAERAELSLRIECPQDLPDVLADAERMQQVVINLIHNAIKFTPAGGEIVLTASAEPDKVVFQVHDNGVGISPDDLPRIFERFYKADRARSGGGTGLGLSIARHMVEAHGGRIWAESIVGKGSNFYFSLPLA